MHEACRCQLGFRRLYFHGQELEKVALGWAGIFIQQAVHDLGELGARIFLGMFESESSGSWR